MAAPSPHVHAPGWFPATAFAVALATGCGQLARSHVHDLHPDVSGRLPAFEQVVARAPEFRVQWLVSRVSVDEHGRPRLRRSAFRLGAEYFYPASAIKLAAAVAALQELAARGISLDAPLTIAPLVPGEAPQRGDPSNQAGGEITVGHELRKLALVSDNQAFNRLVDLVGFDALNDRMHALGLRSARINHRLSDPREIPDAGATASVTFRTEAGEVTMPARRRRGVERNRGPGLLIGRGFQREGVVTPGPTDFSARNGISLEDLQDLLVGLVRPDIEVGRPPLRLPEDSRRRLLEALRIYPRESANPVYPAAEYPDDFVKFLLPGVRRVFPALEPGERIEIIGKSGQAYGFTIENAYLHNAANGAAAFVAAVLYTNADGVLNDDVYEYDTVARPFMADLGEMVARRWLSGVEGQE